MNPREERGQVIAAKGGITQNGDSWLVPSQSDQKKMYVVRLNPEHPYCSCPDYAELGGINGAPCADGAAIKFKCKHLIAVEIVRQRTLFPDGSETITERVTVTTTVQRKSYPQIWDAYNKAQTVEKDHFQVLLHGLCCGVKEPEQKRGRPRIPLSDALFSITYKVYSGFSSRRFSTDMRAAHAAGYLSRPVSYNSVCKAMERADLFDVLRELIYESALPLKAVETGFSVDSSGFSAARNVTWFSEKYGKEKSGRDWCKIHVICGNKTQIVAAVEIHDRNANDSPQFFPLVETAAQNFKIEAVCADKQYSSAGNLETVAFHGGTAFIPFKSNTTGKTGGLWQRMHAYFVYRQEEFLAHYHQRSNIESCFSMMKRKHGDFLRSKTDTAMKNEALCKVLAHNLCVLIQEMHELGIEPEFWGEQPTDALAPAILPFKRPG